MALTNSGFDGSVTEADFARMFRIGGHEGVESSGAWAVTQGTGRQVSVAADAGRAFACGVISKDTAAILASLSTPTNGQWFLIVRRITWSTNTVTVEAIPHSTTSTTAPTVAPTTFPTFNDDPGVVYDQKLAWAWVRSSDTTMVLFDLRKQPAEGRLTVVEGALATAREFAADSTALAAMTPSAGRLVYLASADADVRGNGTAFKLAGRKSFASAAAQTAWSSSFSGLLEVDSRSVRTDTGIEDRWNGSAWKEWESDYITWATAPSNLNVGTGGSAATVQRYKWIGGRIWFDIEYTLGNSGYSVGTNPATNLPFAIKLVGGIGNAIMSGDGIVYDSSAGAVTNYTKAIQNTATSILIRTYAGSPAAINSTTPIPWNPGDKLTVGFWGDPA